MLSDVLCVIGQLSKQLQDKKLDLTEILPLKNSALGRSNGLKEIKGQCESDFIFRSSQIEARCIINVYHSHMQMKNLK